MTSAGCAAAVPGVARIALSSAPSKCSRPVVETRMSSRWSAQEVRELSVAASASARKASRLPTASAGRRAGLDVDEIDRGSTAATFGSAGDLLELCLVDLERSKCQRRVGELSGAHLVLHRAVDQRRDRKEREARHGERQR